MPWVRLILLVPWMMSWTPGGIAPQTPSRLRTRGAVGAADGHIVPVRAFEVIPDLPPVITLGAKHPAGFKHRCRPRNCPDGGEAGLTGVCDGFSGVGPRGSVDVGVRPQHSKPWNRERGEW
jgi:hypothetical protein